MANKSTGTRRELDVAQQIVKRLLETLQADSRVVGDVSLEGAMARGRAFGLAGHLEEAMESCREALTIDPSAHEAAARLAILQLRAGRYVDALATATALAAKAPDYELREMTSDEHVSSFTLLGDALVKNGRVDDAIHAYEAARKASSRDTTAAARLAKAYIATGQPKKALAQAGIFANNPHYYDLSAVLNLGQTNEALLPSFDVSAVPAPPVGGRPLLVAGEARIAPVVDGDATWCADVPGVLDDGSMP